MSSMSNDKWVVLYDQDGWQIKASLKMGPHAIHAPDYSVFEFDNDDLIACPGHDGYVAPIPWPILMRLREAHVAWLAARL